MSISTRQSYSNFQQKPSSHYQPPQRNFISEKLYNTETDEINQSIETNYEITHQSVDSNSEPQEVDSPYVDNNEFCYDEYPNFQSEHPTADQT